MAAYSQIAKFGTVMFDLSDVRATEKPSTLKTCIGKTFIEKSIPLRNTKDKALSITGVITGLSQTSGQTQAEAIETDRAALIALDDGYYHVWADGKHSGNFAIVPGSLSWEDLADRDANQPNKFTMELIEWK